MKLRYLKDARLVLYTIISSLLISSIAGSIHITQDNPVENGGIETISIDIPIGEYRIQSTEAGQTIFIEGFGRTSIPGEPALPSKIFAIAIPPGAQVEDISYETGESIVLPGTYTIDPVVLPRVIGEENPALYQKEYESYEQRYSQVYGNDDPYPGELVEFVRLAGYRKYNLVDVQVTPFSFKPLSGQLTYYPEVTVLVSYSIPDNSIEPMVDDLVRMEQTAREIIINYDQAQQWYQSGGSGAKGLHDFVIITLDSLTSSVTSLVDWEMYKGRNVEVVTTSWIDSHYTGYDLPEKMRNFLMEKYPGDEWGIEDLLVVGDYDDVPIRRCWQDLGYGKPETDLYYAELSLPDSESWDANQNQRWGETYGDPIDFYSEIHVGRIPWSDPQIVESICEKSVAYEENNDPMFKENILLLGAFFWDDDPNPRTDNAVLMEYKVNDDLHPWMSEWTMTRMYEEGYSTYPMDYDLNNNNVVSVWSSGKFAFVNWAGHGSPDACWRYHHPHGYFIADVDCYQLNDEYPAIIFADACSNSDTDHFNIGKAMLRQGAVGFLGVTKVASGCPGWDHPNDGSSQSLDYYFTTSCTSGEYTQGEAHQRALREMYTGGLWSYMHYEMFEWGALWGNPNLGMTPIGDLPYIKIRDITSDSLYIHAIVSNEGLADATDVEWSIEITGGLLGLINSATTGTIDTLAIGEEQPIQSEGIVFGLGLAQIKITAYLAQKDAEAVILGPFIIL